MKRYFFGILISVLFLTNCSKKNKPVYEMVLVKAGTFLMGNNNGEPGEGPVHAVEISKAFYIGKYEVTYNLYDRFCDENKIPRQTDKGWGRDERPVMVGKMYDVIRFCNWLSEKNGLQPCYEIVTRDNIIWNQKANGYRLSTEAEWEFAARGGIKSKGYIFSGSNDCTEVAWSGQNSMQKTHPVGQKKPNELGIYDMSGNLWEWVWDLFDLNYYKKSPAKDPVCKKSSSSNWRRIKRGGSWDSSTVGLRVSFRSVSQNEPDEINQGIRLVRNY